MDITESSTGVGRLESSALVEERREARAATRKRPAVRAYALAGVGLFLLAWLIGGVGEGLGLMALVPYADAALSLGFVLALFAAALAGASLWQVVPVGAVAGIGHFYKGQDHTTHVLSGGGFGLSHTGHFLLGLILIGIATVAAAVLAYYLTRTRPGGPEEESE